MISYTSFLLIAFAIIYLIYFVTFFYNYKKICHKYLKWSKGEFTPPVKRINWLILYGVALVGLFVGLHFLIPYIFDFCIDIYLDMQGYTEGWEIIDGTRFFGDYEKYDAYTIQKGNLHFSLLLPEFFVECAIFILCINLIAKMRKKTKRYAYYEALYSLLGLSVWASIVSLVVCGFVFAIGITLAAIGIYLIGIIIHICMAEEIEVKKSGLAGFFGVSRKVWATKNFDGTASDINGKKYKPDN